MGILSKIAKKVRVIDTSTYEIRGKREKFPKEFFELESDPGAWRSAAIYHVSKLIYNKFYLDQRAPTNEETLIPVIHRAAPEFQSMLRKANNSTGWYQSGWVLVSQEKKTYKVSDGSLTLIVKRQDIREAGRLVAGTPITIRFPKDLPFMSPGFYTAISNTGPPRSNIQRLYINIESEEAGPVLYKITEIFTNQGIKGQVKILNNPDRFGRPDSCTVYLEKPDLLSHLKQFHMAFSGINRRKNVPAFAFHWMNGVGYAEELNNGAGVVESFGENRAKIISKGIVDAYLDKKPALKTIKSALHKSGLNPERLYLNPNSTDDFVMAIS